MTHKSKLEPGVYLQKKTATGFPGCRRHCISSRRYLLELTGVDYSLWVIVQS